MISLTLSATVQNAEIVHSTTLCKAYKTLDVTGGQRKLTSFVTQTVRGPISQLYLRTRTVHRSNTCGLGILRTRNSTDSEFEDPHTMHGASSLA